MIKVSIHFKDTVILFTIYNKVNYTKVDLKCIKETST